MLNRGRHLTRVLQATNDHSCLDSATCVVCCGVRGAFIPRTGFRFSGFYFRPPFPLSVSSWKTRTPHPATLLSLAGRKARVVLSLRAFPAQGHYGPGVWVLREGPPYTGNAHTELASCWLFLCVTFTVAQGASLLARPSAAVV